MEARTRSADESVSLIFLPSGISVNACPGDTVLDAALDNHIELPHECGGNCACTTCHVLIAAGHGNLSPMELIEAERLATSDSRSAESRLACQALLLRGGVTLTIVEAE